MDLLTYQKDLNYFQLRQLSIDSENKNKGNLHELIDNEKSVHPDKSYESKCGNRTLFNNIEKLPSKMKAVLNLYYFEGLNLKEIARIMGVTESRISQIHSKSLTKLKSIMNTSSNEG